MSWKDDQTVTTTATATKTDQSMELDFEEVRQKIKEADRNFFEVCKGIPTVVMDDWFVKTAFGGRFGIVIADSLRKKFDK